MKINLKKAVRKVYKKKAPVRAKKNTIPKTMVSAGMGFPKKMLTTLKYVETVPLVSTAGGLGVYGFSANTVVDPNNTGAGHQPNYADQYSALYNKFIVIGSKMRATFIPASSTVGCVAVGILLDDDSALVPSSFSGIFEQTQSKHKYINFNSAKPTIITSTYSAKKTVGSGSGLMNNTSLVGTAGNIGTGSDPAQEMYYVLCAQSADGVSTNTLVVAVEITYIVLYFELKDVSQS